MPLWALLLSLFYTVLVGIVIGKLILKTRGGGLPDGASITAQAEIPKVRLHGLLGDETSGPAAMLRPISRSPEHARKLADARLEALGLPSGADLIELVVSNPKGGQALHLSDDEGSLVVETAAGTVRSLSLPSPDARSGTDRLLLIQKRLDGVLEPGATRSGWKLMAKPVKMDEIKSAKLTLPDGRSIDLSPEG